MYVTPKRCPRCRYERQPTNTAPDWQCPSCGVAYAKAEGSAAGVPQPSRVAGLAPRASGGSFAKWLVIGLCVAGIGWLLVERFRLESQSRAVAVAQAGDEQPEVIMYATTWCPYCQKSRDFFQRYGIRYVEYDVERNVGAYAENKRLGGGGVPMIVVGDQLVAGYNEQQLTQLLGPWMR